jgi:DNA-binding transcriptional MerR regulator
MTIGELAERFGLATSVIRHWESLGLIDAARREGGQRRYELEPASRRVALILLGKDAGFSLEEIRALFAGPTRTTRRAAMRRKLDELDERAARIQAARALLVHALACRHHAEDTCPVFARIIDERAHLTA